MASALTHRHAALACASSNKPSRIALTSDSAGNTILRESLFTYDQQTGVVRQQQDRMCDTPCYVTNTFDYDSYGNRKTLTDEAGLVVAVAVLMKA